MNQRIIYTAPEGNLCVVIPTGEISMDDLLNRVRAEHPAAQIVDVADVPSDRTFRNAWKEGEQGKRIGVCVDTAKGLCHDRRRAKRAAEFAPLDVEATIPAKQAQAEAARQAIRDKHAGIQSDIDAATTPEELKAIIEREAL